MLLRGLQFGYHLPGASQGLQQQAAGKQTPPGKSETWRGRRSQRTYSELKENISAVTAFILRGSFLLTVRLK